MTTTGVRSLPLNGALALVLLTLALVSLTIGPVPLALSEVASALLPGSAGGLNGTGSSDVLVRQHAIVTEIRLPETGEEALGALIYLSEFACGVSGYMEGVNPFNQPGVEAYKKNMFHLLGKPGY